MTTAPSELYALAELAGIQLSYHDVSGQIQTASPESLLRVLQCLDIPIERFEQAPDVLRETRLEEVKRLLEPVYVAWESSHASFLVRIPLAEADRSISCRLTTEQGATQVWNVKPEQTNDRAEREVAGYRYVEARVPLSSSLPIGYHRLEVTVGRQSATALVLSAPATAHVAAGVAAHRWGVFLPLYALHSQSSWGAGDFADLTALNDWVADCGGGLVASLPLLASYYDQSGDESPYRPVSRLFWNEFFVDVSAAPELAKCPAARVLLDSTALRRQQAELRAAYHVDYRWQMDLKRQVLEQLARCFFQDPSERGGALDEFCKRHPDAERYAQFRAADVRHGRPWTNWPERLRAGELNPGDYDEDIFRYHLYVQWLVDEQLTQLAARAAARRLTWYLDLPLGVHPYGFDVWRYPEAFAMGVSGGAPPDNFFTKGQFWDFLPLHPRRLRASGYQYLLSVFRAHLQYAKLLRIDHVMGLHRLFWIPMGSEAKDGVYVRYAAEELYAVLTIESRRHQARIIGEDLGTVPPEVGVAMDRHKIGRLYVVQYECRPNSDWALPDAGANSVASLNTHDMPPFAAFWQGLDIDDRQGLGLLNDEEVQAERTHRERLRQALVEFLHRRGLLADTEGRLGDVLEACLAYLASSAAEVVLVNLEDLWMEIFPQNTPGTITQRINWRRKARLSLEQIREDPYVQKVLRRVDNLRRHRG